MNGWIYDLHHAVRGLRKAPLLSVVIILSLALGIGANSAIFCLVNAILLQSLPVRDPGKLVSLYMTGDNSDEAQSPISLKMFVRLRKQQSVFSGMFATVEGVISNIEANGVKYAGSVNRVSEDYFETLGIAPLLGRFIGAEDVRLEAGTLSPVAVLDYRCWQHRYHADLKVCGEAIYINGERYTVIGVTPQEFKGLAIEAAPDVTVPLALNSGRNAGRQEIVPAMIGGRVRPGLTLPAARAQLATLWPNLLSQSILASHDAARRAELLRTRIAVQEAGIGTSYLRERLRHPLRILMGFVVVVLLISCVNLANLILARSSVRRQEFGIRLALGANRWLVIRQLLVESLVLSVTGAGLGLILARYLSRWFAATVWTGYVPLALNPSPDGRVLAFTGCVAVLTGILFGIVPAFFASQTDPTIALRSSSRTTHRGMGLPGKILIGIQVCSSFVLVIGAAMFMQTLWKLHEFDPGFRRENVLTVQLFQTAGRMNIPNRADYYRSVAEGLSEVPGVELVSYSHVGPVTNYEVKDHVRVPAYSSGSVEAIEGWVGPGFFRALGMHVFAGREFDWGDNEHTRRVAVVSESLARQLFPHSEAVGHTIDADTNPEHRGLEIVGVVNSASLWLLRSQSPKAIYMPLIQEPGFDQPMITIKVRPGATGIAQAARSLLERFGYHYPLRIQSLEERSEMYLSQERVLAMLSTIFGGLALLLASIGIYGLLSFAVSRRSSEIGVRMALGARPHEIQRMVLLEASLMMLVGLAGGIPLGLAGLRMISGMLFGIAPFDPATVVVSATLLLSVGLFAGYLPARRASHTDPMRALQSE